ncbi:MAG TPA: hypothetical protein VF910_07680 [Candidatus Bathyarchaeia archaeon]
MGAILAPFLASMMALASFIYWQTALLYLSMLGLFLACALRFRSRHDHLEWDDKLTDIRREEALRRFLKEVSC